MWDLPDTAYLSAWLLLLITAGAMICSAIFERRLWCRHLCPIGGMNGMFAKLSMTELRASQGVCSGARRSPGLLPSPWSCLLDLCNCNSTLSLTRVHAFQGVVSGPRSVKP